MSVMESLARVEPSPGIAAANPLLGLPQPHGSVTPAKLVELCYTLIYAAEAVGIVDLADGEYRPGDTTLEQGIERQLNYLLDQVGCTRPGFRLLEIGTGYGHLLELARQRGAYGVGVNVSAEQVEYCRERGLQVYCCTYRDLLESPESLSGKGDWHPASCDSISSKPQHSGASPRFRINSEWRGKFDGVIANGSLEHWVQPQDVQAGRMNAIYEESFAIAHDALDPHLPDARYVTTAIHVEREVKPEYLLTPWYLHPRGSDRRHFSLLHHWMGGWYPVAGQLEQCARPYFSLISETDGTQGYKRANEYRRQRMLRGLYTNPKLLGRIANCFLHHPLVTSTMIESFFIEQSWDWQFQGAHPPMRLLRQTWRRRANSPLPRMDSAFY